MLMLLGHNITAPVDQLYDSCMSGLPPDVENVDRETGVIFPGGSLLYLFIVVSSCYNLCLLYKTLNSDSEGLLKTF
jgi:hypothetical protein